jgi:hypothetical protein
MPRAVSPSSRELFVMNKTRYLLALSFAVAIITQMPSAYAATVVTYSTTVRTTAPYWGIQPAPCCYSRVVVTGVAPTAVITTKPPAKVVYVAPPVVVYPAPRSVYVPYYPTAYYYVP